MACTEVTDPFLVEVMRSCNSPISVARFGWYPTALGMRPSSAETSDPAWVKRKMLSMKSSVSAPSSSRKYSATVSPVSADAQTRSGRLGHLAVDQRGFRLAAGSPGLMTPDSLHFQPEIVAFTGALADAGKHGIAAVLLGDVVDQLHE